METTSQSFCYIDLLEHVSFIAKHKKRGTSTSSISVPDPDNLTWDDIVAQYRHTSAYTLFYTIGKDQKGNATKIPVPPVVLYNYRGAKELKDMN